MPRPRMKTKSIAVLVVVMALILIPAGYMGSYYALLADNPRYLDYSQGEQFLPRYRAGVSDDFYKLAYEVDLRLRPKHWNFKESNYNVPR